MAGGTGDAPADYRRPSGIPFPDENPFSKAKAELGRMLLFDPILSGSRSRSCATCHNPSLSWGDGLAHAVGEGRVPMAVRSPTLLNVAWTPRLGWDGKLDPKKFKPDSLEMKGQALFFGKARCAECHPAPYYTDNSMHDLKVERFYKTQPINGMIATAQGPIKTFPLRGIKESPPYLHDGRLLTLEDTVEFFNLVLELKLTAGEKKALVAFMRQL